MSQLHESLAVVDKINKHHSINGRDIRHDFKTTTQKTAYNMLKREELNAKKNRLQCLLEQQYISRYGSKQAKSEINGYIKTTIRRFIDSHPSVHAAEGALPELEGEIREVCNKMKAEIKSRIDKVRATAAAANKVGSTKKEEEPHDTESFKASDTKVDPNQWFVLNTMLSVTDEEIMRKEKNDAVKKRILVKAALDQQNADNRGREMASARDRDIYAKINKAAYDDYLADQATQQHKREIGMQAERNLRLAQIEERKQIREEERMMKIRQEQADMARARKLAEDEQRFLQEKKIREKAAQDRLVEENERNKQIKAEEKLRDAAYEKRLNREYAEKLDREERERANAFESRLANLHAIGARFDSVVGEQRREEDALRDRRDQEEIARKSAADAAREKAKADHRKAEIEKSCNFNASILDRKRREKEQARADALAYRRRLEDELAQAEERDRQAAANRRAQSLNVRNKLDEQMLERQKMRRDKDELSGVEVKINKDLISKLTESDELLTRVKDKMKPLKSNFASSSGNTIF